MRLPLAATAAALLLAGCGDPLVDGDYRGEPLIRLAGRIEGDAKTSSIQSPYLGIIWVIYDFSSGDETGRVVTSLVPVPDAKFPGTFELALFDPPPPEAFNELFGVRYAMGAIVALDDVDGDRRFTVDPVTGTLEGADRFFGSSFSYQLLLYVDRIDQPACARFFFEDPANVHLGRYQLATVDECGHSFLSPLAEETPIRLILFPTTATLPDTPPHYVEPECPGEEMPDCEADPSDPRCWEPGFDCQVESCELFTLLYEGCLDLHCPEATDFLACSEERCGPEGAALSACMRERCPDVCVWF
jgi:hypothetical protein